MTTCETCGHTKKEHISEFYSGANRITRYVDACMKLTGTDKDGIATNCLCSKYKEKRKAAGKKGD